MDPETKAKSSLEQDYELISEAYSKAQSDAGKRVLLTALETAAEYLEDAIVHEDDWDSSDCWVDSGCSWEDVTIGEGYPGDDE